MTEHKLEAITLPFSEGGTTLRLGEEATTEAVGEEGPTAPSAEDPASSITFNESKRGGPFGAY